MVCDPWSVLHYKLQEKFKQFIRLVANICQDKVDNIDLLTSTLFMSPKNKTFMFIFVILISK